MLDDFQDDDELAKGSEFLDEFRQRLNTQPLENLEERRNDINRSQHIFLGTVLGVGLAGIVSWFILSPEYSQTQDAEIPVVRRPQAAIKVQPAEPGGMEILNQDKTVYDIVEKKDAPEIKVENLLPPPEEPKLPDVISENAAPEEIKIADSSVMQNAEKIIAAEEKKETAKNESDAIKIVVKKETNALEKKPESVKTKEVDASLPQPVSASKTPEAVSNSAPKANSPATAAPAGSWQIQLISSPHKTAMEKAWVDLTKKHASLKGLSHEIETADLGAKGTFYRLKAGAFKNRADADNVCNAVKSSGGSCLVKKK